MSKQSDNGQIIRLIKLEHGPPPTEEDWSKFIDGINGLAGALNELVDTVLAEFPNIVKWAEQVSIVTGTELPDELRAYLADLRSRGEE